MTTAPPAAEKFKKDRRRLTQAQVDEAVRLHEQYQSGRFGGRRALLSYCDLSKLNLANRDLRDVDFTGAWLVETDMRKAKLDNSVFYAANLTGAKLTQASLVRCDLRGAVVRGADLAGADLFDADLRDGRLYQRATGGEYVDIEIEAPGAAELVGASFNNANLSRARLSGAIAQHTDFTDAVMKGCKLVRADLRHAMMDGCNLEGADISGADLRGASMRNVVLTNAQMALTETAGADMTGALTNADAGKPLAALGAPLEQLIAHHETWVRTNGAEGLPLDLSGYDLRKATAVAHGRLTALRAQGAVFYGLNLEGAWLQAAQMTGADLRTCNMKGADLRGANLTDAKLNNCDLRDCNLGPLAIDDTRTITSKLNGAVFRHADLRGANLARASLHQTDLRAANLTGTRLDNTDLSTALTAGSVGLELPPQAAGE